MNGRRFRNHLAHRLIPLLQPSDIVILNNLQAHKVDGVLEAAGARLLNLPPYNPEFNQIEQVFVTMKALLRIAAACTMPDLWATIRADLTLLHGVIAALLGR